MIIRSSMLYAQYNDTTYCVVSSVLYAQCNDQE
jgi:hypothetical protein